MNSNYILIFYFNFYKVIFYLANYKIAKYLNLIDVPDRDRKIILKCTLNRGFFYFLIFYLFFY